jgi:hypothetical protein
LAPNTLKEMSQLFSFGREPGLGQWLADSMHEIVRERLESLPANPLSKVQFNQLLVVSKAASISDGFFTYYWRTAPDHTYDVTAIEGFDKRWIETPEQVITGLEHLRWGLYRLYIDGLLYFGNVKAAFNALRSMDIDEVTSFFRAKRFDTAAISVRGPALKLQPINRDERHQISEMACKTFGELPEDHAAAFDKLNEAWGKHEAGGGGNIGFRSFLEKYLVNSSNRDQLVLSYDDVADKDIDSQSSLKQHFDSSLATFLRARERAIKNTEIYLSMVNDLDVYVATSMRSRQNFRDMAAACEQIFSDAKLEKLHLRYFDPTMSAARGHEDKGLIECLMVKCAKVLVYCEGEKESYGKDAEAAMALSLGKPVVFYCDQGKKTNFYRDVHPLARLIDFRSGVAVGAIVTDKVSDVAELLSRIFTNRMEYRLDHHPSRPGFLKLYEKLTDSVVRLQTDDELITKTFWNNYNNRTKQSPGSLAAGKEAERLQE